MLENQLFLVDALLLLSLSPSMIKRTRVPESKRMTVKLDASMASAPSASRQSTEFAANATNAKNVNTSVLEASRMD
jgi:hypothetical protein